MSCNPTFGYNSLVGNCYTTSTSSPDGPLSSVQYNDDGDFGGDSSFTFDNSILQLAVRKIKPDVVVDRLNSIGTAGQVLSSTGSALQYITPATASPAGTSGDVQFNSSGTFASDSSGFFTFDNTTGVKQLKVNKLNAGMSVAAPVHRVSALSTSAQSSMSFGFNDQFLFVGDGPYNTSGGVGIGFSTSPVNEGIIACSTPGAQWNALNYNALRHSFRCQNVEYMKVEPTGVTTMTIAEPYQIKDGFGSLGTNRSTLTSTGIGLLWTPQQEFYYFGTGQTFRGTAGHHIFVKASAPANSNGLIVVDVTMEREGGVQFDLIAPGNVIGTNVIATLPSSLWPVGYISEIVYSIGYSSANTNWGVDDYTWGGLTVDDVGRIRMVSPNNLPASIITIAPLLEKISCQIVYFKNAATTSYTGDGITRP